MHSLQLPIKSHVPIFLPFGMSKADVHARLRELACLRLGDVKRGAWRPSFTETWSFAVDLDDDDSLIPAVLHPERFQITVLPWWAAHHTWPHQCGHARLKSGEPLGEPSL